MIFILIECVNIYCGKYAHHKLVKFQICFYGNNKYILYSLEIMLQYILNFVSNLLKLNSFGTNLSFSTYIKKICIILQATLTL
ncbi:hypothetical protein RIR_jg9159.t1 [Rhizophagus irregularis DAOM 181602=DAOM 197198]|nr:hypothetical protein RIR_jg9159.t1 [Rhizophagus irregularis DAOM 181602=DAOM 197198]